MVEIYNNHSAFAHLNVNVEELEYDSYQVTILPMMSNKCFITADLKAIDAICELTRLSCATMYSLVEESVVTVFW